MNYHFINKQLFSFRYIYYSSLLLVAILILSVFCSLDENSYNWFFSSDALYLPSIYKDVFLHGNTISGWHFNPAPNFFPDMPVYFLLMFLTGSFLSSTALFAILQYVLIIVLFRAILLQFLESGIVNKIVVFSNLSLSLFFVQTLLTNDLYLSFYLLINSYHTSAFTLALFSYLLFLQFEKKEKRRYLLFLTLVSLLGVLSDQLMFITITLPIVFMSVLKRKHIPQKGIIGLPGFFTFLGSVLGLCFFFLLRNTKSISFGTPYKMFAFSDMFDSANLFFKDTFSFLFQFNINSLVLLISLISLCLGIFYSIISIVKRGRKHYDNFTSYIIFSTILSIAVIFTPLINGNYSGLDCYRYNIYPFYLGVLNFPLYFKSSSFWFTRIIPSIIIAFLFGFFLLMIAKNFSMGSLKSYLEFYPEKVKTIDGIAHKFDLKKGIGNYWDAKYITMFSRQNVQIYSVHPGLEKYYHVANENWFNADTAIFNFIIDREMNHQAIQEKFSLDKIQYIYRNPDIIKVPDFTYCENSYVPILIK